MKEYVMHWCYVESINPMTDVSTAKRILEAGEVCAVPTDTFYAFGAKATDGEAVDKVYRIKNRPAEFAVPLLIRDWDQIEPYLDRIPRVAMELADKFWPGALTMLLGANNKLPPAVRPKMVVGVRIPNNETTKELLGVCDFPICGTSANLSGAPPTKDAAFLRRQFPKVEIIAGDCGDLTEPSTVVNLSVKEPFIVRSGAIAQEAVTRYLPSVLSDV